jgi:hypothetical protein
MQIKISNQGTWSPIINVLKMFIPNHNLDDNHDPTAKQVDNEVHNFKGQ